MIMHNFLKIFSEIEKIFKAINVSLYKYVFFYRYIMSNAWEIGEVLAIILWIFCIKKFKISGQKTALVGFGLFIIMVLLSLFSQDDVAGFVAQYVFLFFAISFVQEFSHFLKHENK
jgi:hypothetical protein